MLVAFFVAAALLRMLLLEGEDVTRDSGAVTDAKQDSSSVMSWRATEIRRSYKEALTCKIK